MAKRKKAKPKATSEEVQIYYAQTGTLVARTLFVAVVAGIACIPMAYLHHHYGPAAVLITVGALILVLLVAGLIMIGVSTANKAQENFIDALGELKSVFAPVAREQSKTIGVADRAAIEVEKKQILNDMATQQRQQPQLEDQQMRDQWIGEFDDADTVDGDFYEVR